MVETIGLVRGGRVGGGASVSLRFSPPEFAGDRGAGAEGVQVESGDESSGGKLRFSPPEVAFTGSGSSGGGGVEAGEESSGSKLRFSPPEFAIAGEWIERGKWSGEMIPL